MVCALVGSGTRKPSAVAEGFGHTPVRACAYTMMMPVAMVIGKGVCPVSPIPSMSRGNRGKACVVPALTASARAVCSREQAWPSSIPGFESRDETSGKPSTRTWLRRGLRDDEVTKSIRAATDRRPHPHPGPSER